MCFKVVVYCHHIGGTYPKDYIFMGKYILPTRSKKPHFPAFFEASEVSFMTPVLIAWDLADLILKPQSHIEFQPFVLKLNTFAVRLISAAAWLTSILAEAGGLSRE